MPLSGSDGNIWTNTVSSEKRKYELRARAEKQEETRQRIVEATAELHQEVGPAQTTVAEIARRAGVNRVTVYNHFPEESELFAACQAHFLSGHPLPDFAGALALADPAERVRGVLLELYRSYRRTEPMTAKVLRDRATMPALDALMAQTLDAMQTELTRALSAGLRRRGTAARRTRAALALALDFWTWQRLAHEGLSDDEAAELMARLVAT
jgi:AcrR family transcriptional regulator